MYGANPLMALLGGGAPQPQQGLFGQAPMGGGAQMYGGPAVSNPFVDSLLASVAGTNPGVVSDFGAAMGLPAPGPAAPGGVPDIGSLMDPTAFPEGVFTGMGGAPGIDPTGAGGPGGNPVVAAQALGKMAGVKGPPAAPAPIMNAGVSGAQKAPEIQTSMQGTGAMLQLLKSLQAPTPIPVKPLGSFL